MVGTLAQVLFSSSIAAQTLSGGATELHEGGFLSAAGPVLSDTTGNVRLERGTLGELAAGPSTGTNLQLRGGVLHAVLPDTDGDGTLDVSDDDDDNDGLLDDDEAFWGTLPLVADTDGDGLSDGDEVNVLETHPLKSDSDGDGIPDGNDLAPLSVGDCRTRNPKLVLVWGNDAPFGVDHEHSPGLGDRYLMNEGKTLPGLAADDLGLPATLAEDLRSGVQDLFAQARSNLASLPATSNGLNVTNHLSGAPPGVGFPGSPSLLYIIDRSAITDTNFGGLDGLAWTGVNRFSRSCTGGLGSVIIDPGTVPPATDPGYAAALASLVEHVAHEAGHLYGLRHVLRGGLAGCTGETHSGDPAVMDYFDDGANAVLAQCASPGCPVTEPPDCGGNETGDHHNPLYHYLRYVVGDSTADLTNAGITPASWDQESVPVVTWEVQFNFACASCNLIPLYNVRILEVLPGGGERVRWPVGEAFETGLQTLGENAYPDITIEELNQLTITLPETSGLKLVASRTDPATTEPLAPVANVQIAAEPLTQAPVYPPPQRTEPVVIQAVLLEVNETAPGVFETTTLANDLGVNAQPRYESRPDGFYQLPTPEKPTETRLTTSALLPPATVDTTGMLTDAQGNAKPPALPQDIPIPVPEPAASAAWLAGIAALLALGRKRREAVKHFT